MTHSKLKQGDRLCRMMANFVHEATPIITQDDNPSIMATAVIDTMAEGLIREVLYGGNEYTLDALEDMDIVLDRIKRRVARDKGENRPIDKYNDAY